MSGFILNEKLDCGLQLENKDELMNLRLGAYYLNIMFLKVTIVVRKNRAEYFRGTHKGIICLQFYTGLHSVIITTSMKLPPCRIIMDVLLRGEFF
jgi:hypothetical protein